jgi:hypothetical protein
VDISHCGALPLPPKETWVNPTAPTYEISVNVYRAVESMSNQNRPNESNRGLGVPCMISIYLVTVQVPNHNKNNMTMALFSLDVSGVANIAQLGQREEKGSSGSSALRSLWA